jgi:hypothetical protein
MLRRISVSCHWKRCGILSKLIFIGDRAEFIEDVYIHSTLTKGTFMKKMISVLVLGLTLASSMVFADATIQCHCKPGQQGPGCYGPGH